MKKILVLIGNYGSGKTELALNFAFRAAKQGKTALIDLDIVNPYFRLSERKALVESAGITLVSPHFVSTNVETLSLPAEVSSAFHMDWDTVVFDAGGDAAGATALGRFRDEFLALPEDQWELLNVVNVRRPLSSTADRVYTLMEQLQRRARLPVTGLIHNSNLGREASEEDLFDGYAVVKEVSERSGVPVAYTAGTSGVLEPFLRAGFDNKYIGSPLEIEIYMHRDWDSFVREGI
jgi:Mrp family chromosome partitioning ATPase